MEENKEEKLNQSDSSVADESENVDFEFEPETDSDSGASVDFAEKLKKLKNELKIIKKERQEFLDGWQKERADFANYKKDEIKRNSFYADRAKENILTDFLPALDSFNMAFGNKEAWEKVDKNWRSGVEYIYSQILSTLEGHGVKQFGAVGEIFDPTLHQSVGVEDTDIEEKDGTIAVVNSKGFIVNESILRPAKVIVYSCKTCLSSDTYCTL